MLLEPQPKERSAGRGAREREEPDLRVPVMRPRLPPVRALLPYLRRIDASRTYSNWGPLASELEERLRTQLALSRGSICSAGNGTVALAAAIYAAAGPASRSRPYALVPAYTFVATALAVEQCGYRPFLADVDPRSWMLDPGRLAQLDLSRVGLVVPVAAYGRAVPQREWLAFQRRTGVPVVIDGAASFEAVAAAPRRYVGRIPLAMSFHATKAFATGEGGCIIGRDPEFVAEAARALNFGFRESRECRGWSTNGKMSEYHAAVGLAELDGWAVKRAAFAAVAERYRRLLGAELAACLHAAGDVASCYALFECSSQPQAARACAELGARGVDSRLWYGTGLQDHQHFGAARRERLSHTPDIGRRLVGLPMAVDLRDAAIRRVVAALRVACKS